LSCLESDLQDTVQDGARSAHDIGKAVYVLLRRYPVNGHFCAGNVFEDGADGRITEI